MISEFLANFRSEKQLTLPTGVKGKWIGTGANKRLDTYYNNGKRNHSATFMLDGLKCGFCSF